MPFTVKEALSKQCHDTDHQSELLQRFDDKLYLYATSCEVSPLGVQVYIDSHACLTFLNDRFKTEAIALCKERGMATAWAEQAPTVGDIREGRRPGLLFSASAMVYDSEGYLLMLKRDEGAPVEPLKWQFPGGRSESVDASETALLELSQEIKVTDRLTGQELTHKDLDVSLNDRDYKSVVMYVDGEFWHENQVVYLLDKSCNTLEQFLKISAPEPARAYDLSDKEFGREVAFMDPEEVINGRYPLVSYLMKMKPRLKNNNKMELANL